MANLGAHRADGVRRSIEEAGSRVLDLSPYDPGLNPIEPAWATWKDVLRRDGARSCRDLASAIGRTKDCVTQRDLRGRYRHASAFAQVA